MNTLNCQVRNFEECVAWARLRYDACAERVLAVNAVTVMDTHSPVSKIGAESAGILTQLRGLLCQQDQATCLHVSGGSKKRERRPLLVPTKAVGPRVCPEAKSDANPSIRPARFCRREFGMTVYSTFQVPDAPRFQP